MVLLLSVACFNRKKSNWTGRADNSSQNDRSGHDFTPKWAWLLKFCAVNPWICHWNGMHNYIVATVPNGCALMYMSGMHIWSHCTNQIHWAPNVVYHWWRPLPIFLSSCIIITYYSMIQVVIGMNGALMSPLLSRVNCIVYSYYCGIMGECHKVNENSSVLLMLHTGKYP